MSAIELRGLTKQYGNLTAVQNVDLTVEAGEVFGFLGPNGAGKSTTIDILLDHARPTAGRARVLGMDAQDETVRVRERTGVLPETFGPLGDMTGRQHVEFALDAKGRQGNPAHLLDRVGLAPVADRPARQYSKGMSQRLMLAIALAGDPDLLILDEPTTGLDPNGARGLRRIINNERQKGTTIFFSSHILEQVEAVCDRVGILNRGQIVAVDTIDGLREAAGTTGEIRLELGSIPEELPEKIRSLDGVSSVQIRGSTLHVACENAVKGKIVWACYEADLSVENVETSEASLEDLFAAYTGGR